MDTTSLSKSTQLLAEELQKQLPSAELSKLTGKMLYQDDKTATYFVVAQIDKTKTKKTKKVAQKPTGLFSWETLLLVGLWTAFLFLVALA